MVSVQKSGVEKRHAEALYRLGRTEDDQYRLKGRKGLFRDFMYREARKLARLGMTMEEIADFWGVSRRTLQRWAAARPDFCHTIKKARAEADTKVEESLYNRARGYKYTEKHYETRFNEVTGRMEKVLVRAIEKHVPPDTTAAVFWLLNRKRERWKDRRQLEITPDSRLPLEIIVKDGRKKEGRVIGPAEEDRALPAPGKGPTE